MSAVEEIEKRALALPVEQRALLAESLLGSLPSPGEEMIDAEELDEVKRREKEIETGQVDPIAEADFWSRIQKNRRR